MGRKGRKKRKLESGREIRRSAYRFSLWEIYNDGKKVGDIEKGAKDFRVFFKGLGVVFYRKTFKEAVNTAMEMMVTKQLPLLKTQPKMKPKPKAQPKPKVKHEAPQRSNDYNVENVEPAREFIKPSDKLVKRAGVSTGEPVIYAAYGANTSMLAMSYRCPTAKPIGRGTIENWRLKFRGCADIEEKQGASVEVALWVIFPQDEEALDRFEGYPHNYTKTHLKVRVEGTSSEFNAMVYIMKDRDNRVYAPSNMYRELLERGYDDFGMSHEQIKKAVKETNTGTQARNWYVV
jgi:hypothetical protein